MMFFLGFASASLIAFLTYITESIRKRKDKNVSEDITFSTTPKGLRKLNEYRYRDNSERTKEMENILRYVNEILKEDLHYEYPKNHPVFSIIRTLTMNIHTHNDLNILKQNGDQIYYKGTSSYTKNFYYREAYFYFFDEEIRGLMIDHKADSVPIDPPLVVELNKAPMISMVWRPDRLINNLKTIGKDVREKHLSKAQDFEEDVLNHSAIYLYPLGITWVHNGNHSVNAGILKSEGEIHVEYIYDMRFMYEQYYFDGTHLINSERDKKTEIQFEFGVLFEIGRILLDYPDIFPNEVQETILDK